MYDFFFFFLSEGARALVPPMEMTPLHTHSNQPWFQMLMHHGTWEAHLDPFQQGKPTVTPSMLGALQ